MTDLLNNHTTDSFRIRNTSLVHAVDVFKTKILPVSHSTSSFLKKPGSLNYSTSAVLQKSHLFHGTNAVKRLAILQTATNSAQVLGTTTSISQSTLPQFSKNASKYLDIGDGLSVIVGLPRIPTWNSLGRPTKPKVGTLGFNIENQTIEFWDGIKWQSISTEEV